MVEVHANDERPAMNQQDLNRDQMTPDQARATLDSAPRLDDTGHDRRIHGWATAAFGALVGGYVGLYQALPEGNSARNVITAFYVLLLFGLAASIEGHRLCRPGMHGDAGRDRDDGPELPREPHRRSRGGVPPLVCRGRHRHRWTHVGGRLDHRQPQVLTTMTTENLTGHARHRLDEVIHAPIRFSIVATLAGVDEAEFSAVRDAIEISDSYVKVKKGYVGKRPRTWLSLTTKGRGALTVHLAALREIAGSTHSHQ